MLRALLLLVLLSGCAAEPTSRNCLCVDSAGALFTAANCR